MREIFQSITPYCISEISFAFLLTFTKFPLKLCKIKQFNSLYRKKCQTVCQPTEGTMEPYHLQSSSFLQRITIMSTVRHLVYNVFTPQVSSANHNQIRYNQTELHRASGRFHIWIVQPTLLAPPRRLATPVGPPTSCWLIEDDVDIKKKHYRKISKYSNSHVCSGKQCRP